MDTKVKNLIVAARDVWDSVFWPRYQAGARPQESAAPLVPGSLVTPAREVANLQTVQGLLVSSDRLGHGVVCARDEGGRVLVRWSNIEVETWAEREDLRLIEAGWSLITIVRCDGHGHRTILRRSLARLQHHWTIELRPDNVLRAARSDGLAWTFTFNPINRAVLASWLYPPEDDDAEALTAAELAAS